MKLNCNQSDIKKVNLFKKGYIEGSNDGDVYVINLFGDIVEDSYSWTDSDVTPIKLAKLLTEAGGKDVEARIHSFGGSIFAGINIYNQLKKYKGRVKTVNLSCAISAASIILCAGDYIEVYRGSTIMIHNAMTYVYGDIHELEKGITSLKKSEEIAISIYKSVSSNEKTDFKKLMESETWINGEEVGNYFNFKLVDHDAYNPENKLIKNSITRFTEIENKIKTLKLK